MKLSIDYSLYLVTDRRLMSTKTVERSVELAIQGGCTLVQLREKALSSLDFYDTAVRVKAVCDHYQVPLIINDRVDIALAVDAAGVHVGQNDLPAAIVRGMIGPDKIVGVSASNLSEALQAVRDGADYLGVGAMFATGTKSDARSVSLDELQAIRAAVELPIVAIGGIHPKTVPQLADTGIDGIAVVSAIVAEQDITRAAGQMKELFLEIKNNR